jgi:hypothetical protein
MAAIASDAPMTTAASIAPARRRTRCIVRMPVSAVAGGGVIAARLSDPRHVLAVAPLASQAALRNHPAVAHAGPVSLDPQRFAHFAQLMGLDRR